MERENLDTSKMYSLGNYTGVKAGYFGIRDGRHVFLRRVGNTVEIYEAVVDRVTRYASDAAHFVDNMPEGLEKEHAIRCLERRERAAETQ
jgi:thymidine phosphorylase